MREDIWVDELNFKSYQNNEIEFIDDSGKSCCVHSLADYTKQVRKEVVQDIKQEVKKLIENKDFGLCNHEYANGYCYGLQYDLAKILDQIQGETK